MDREPDEPGASDDNAHNANIANIMNVVNMLDDLIAVEELDQVARMQEVLHMEVEDLGAGHYVDVESLDVDTHSWEELRLARLSGEAADVEQSQNEDTPPAEPVLFNTELPSEHSYLGALDRVTGTAYLEPRRTYRLPVLVHPQIVYPGEQVPMILSELNALRLELTGDGDRVNAEQQQRDGCLFGLFFASRQNDRYYGVTCQVYEMGAAESGLVRLKTRAQQRFEITRKLNADCESFEHLALIARSGHRLNRLNVSVLPEQQQPDALFGCEVNSWSKFRLNEGMQRRLRDRCAASRPWPRFVYDQYELRSVVQKVKCFLSAMAIETAQMDPVALSYWCAKNVQLRDKHKWEIFQTNSVTKRMMIISQSLDYMRYFVCCQCYAKVAHFNAVFAMSKQGIQTNFCNPAGYIHETNTVLYTVPNAIYLQGIPCAEFSWFPGYAWQIAACSQCNGHLGWKFTVAAGEKNLVPKKFYGLAGARILIRRYVRHSDGEAVEDDADRDDAMDAAGSENEHVDTEDGDDDDDETDGVSDSEFLASFIR